MNELYDTDEIFDFDSLPGALEPQGLLGANPFAAEDKVKLPRHKLTKWPHRFKDGLCTYYDFPCGLARGISDPCEAAGKS